MTKPAHFFRTRTTWLAYLMLGYFGLLPAMISPTMPFLRAEMNLSYTSAALHLSAGAVGVIIAGLFANHLVRLFGRRRLLWFTALSSALCAIIFIASRNMPYTLLSVLAMCFFGANIQVIVQAILSDLHGDSRPIALSEANIAAAATSALAPLLVSSFQRYALGWRSAWLFGIVYLALLVILFRNTPVPSTPSATPSAPDLSAIPLPATRSTLPRAYWMLWLVICMVVSIEFCLLFWCADFLEKAVGLSRIDAVTTITLFAFASVLGRFAGSRLAGRFQIRALILSALLLTFVGFLLFWSAYSPFISITGLFITGLGVANLFPFTMTTAVAVAPGVTDLASARISLAIGLSILLAPLFLGWLSDQIGIRSAYTLVLVLVGLAVVTLLVATASHSPVPSAPPPGESPGAV